MRIWLFMEAWMIWCEKLAVVSGATGAARKSASTLTAFFLQVGDQDSAELPEDVGGLDSVACFETRGMITLWGPYHDCTDLEHDTPLE